MTVRPMNDDLSQLSLLELYRIETENQTAILTRELLALERQESGRPATDESTAHATAPGESPLERLMRAAHSLKGAARIVNVEMAVRLAHALEDCFVAAQRLLEGRQKMEHAGREQSLAKDPPGDTQSEGPGVSGKGAGSPNAGSILPYDLLLRGVDLLTNIAQKPEPGHVAQEAEVQEFLSELAKHAEHLAQGNGNEAKMPLPASEARTPVAAGRGLQATTQSQAEAPPTAGTVTAAGGRGGEGDRVLRLAAENLNRLLGLAGESLVESRWLRPFGEAMQRLKRMQDEMERTLESLRPMLARADAALTAQAGGHGEAADSSRFENAVSLSETRVGRLQELIRQVTEARLFLAERIEELDLYERRSAHLTNRLYLEVLRARMRPFGDGVTGFPRLVRDLARQLRKQVRLEIVGEHTPVDRDILERLESPLNHLLRNAVDHGCELPAERERAGKAPEATIRLEARHSAGMLLVAVSDDGAGVDPGRVRRLITDRKLTTPSVAEKLQDSELLQFLFLPGFSMRETVTEISGRGVGLDVVQSMVKGVRGHLRVSSQPGRGTRFQLHLPLTLSVLRTLLVEVGGEPYAIPLTQIVRTLQLPRDRLQTLEGRPHFQLGDESIGLLAAAQVLECPARPPSGPELPIVVLGDTHGTGRYGLLVDRFLGERELVVQPLDPRLGKVQDISAAALMEDGSPVLIVDVDDLMRSVERFIAAGTPAGIGSTAGEPSARPPKRILAVDDSLTVRELERKLLVNRGYQVDVAVDGMEAWNAVRATRYDLVLTDVDMPRMDGIELAALIKRDPRLKSLPVMIVSYKDRETDRLRGLEAGADYYLTKGSFHDETLLQAVLDLIGEPEA